MPVLCAQVILTTCLLCKTDQAPSFCRLGTVWEQAGQQIAQIGRHGVKITVFRDMEKYDTLGKKLHGLRHASVSGTIGGVQDIFMG